MLCNQVHFDFNVRALTFFFTLFDFSVFAEMVSKLSLPHNFQSFSEVPFTHGDTVRPKQK